MEFLPLLPNLGKLNLAFSNFYYLFMITDLL